MNRLQRLLFPSATLVLLGLLTLVALPAGASDNEASLTSPAEATEEESSPASESAPPEPEPEPQISSAQRDDLVRALRQVRREHRSDTSPARDARPTSVQDALRQIRGTRDPANIFRWIRENIRYEPYAGTLRGPTGALISGSANAVDQALLAQALLEGAGHEVRFVTGRLATSDIDHILAALLAPPLTTRRYDGDDLEVMNTLSAELAPVRRAIADHLWLEILQGEEARPFDPVASPSFGIAPAQASERHDQLPPRLQTRFRMVLVSELKDGQTLEHLVVDGPLARVAYRALTISFDHDHRRTRGHRPTLRLGDDRIRGETIPVAAAERIELRFQFTGTGQEHRWVQTLYQRGQGRDIFDFDHQQFAVAIVPGWTSDNQLRSVGRQAGEAALNAIEQWAESETALALSEADRRAHTTEVLDHLGAALPFAFARTLDRISQAAATNLGVVPLLDRPRIVTTGLLRDGDAFVVDLQVDGDRTRALPVEGVAAGATMAYIGLHGLIRDRLVGELLESYGDHPVTTVGGLFMAAAGQSIPFTTVGPHNLDRLRQIDVDDHIRDRMEADVRGRNMTLLTPLRPVEVGGVSRYGWWAANPVDGNLEGHTADAVVALGEHQERDAVDAARLVRLHLDLVERHSQAAAHATASDLRFPELACSAARQFEQISRAYCATSAAMPRANATQCLANPPSPQTDLLNLRNFDCAAQFAPFRCGSAYARALLDGVILLRPEGIEADQWEPPLCLHH